MTPPIAIHARGLTRKFGHLAAVNQLDLDIAQGEVFGVLGHNGAGKTTTVRLLNGVLNPTAGEIRVLGFDPATEGVALRARTGVLTESPSLEERLTVWDNLAIYAALYGVPGGEIPRRVGELLDTFGLSDRAHERAGALSKGMKQRLALARALVHRPEIVFLDEPTAGLDPVLARSVHELIVNLSQQQGHTVFLCTHNLPEAQRLCHRVAVLGRGKLLAVGTPQELAQRWVGSQSLTLEVDAGDRPKVEDWLAVRHASCEPGPSNGQLIVKGLARQDIPKAIRSLADSGVSIFAVMPHEASLEDVYFALQGQAEVDR